MVSYPFIPPPSGVRPPPSRLAGIRTEEPQTPQIDLKGSEEGVPRWCPCTELTDLEARPTIHPQLMSCTRCPVPFEDTWHLALTEAFRK